VKVNLLVNRHRTDAVQAAIEAAEWLRSQGVAVGCDALTCERVKADHRSDEAFPHADLVVSFGGDGTLIRAAHLCSEIGTPILGVYYGRFGFVTQCRQEDLIGCLETFMAGKAQIEDRMMIHAELWRTDHMVADVHALNEVLLQREATTRMMTFEVEIDDYPLTAYPADGVMVATPTGSTAYNLSVGGPIMDPQIEAMILTAIAPHTLSARPLVLHPDSAIRLNLQAGGGQTRFHLLSGDQVVIRRSQRKTRLLRVDRQDFLMKLSEKLTWSQSLLPGDEA
jgi:NAD+ kinase